MKRLKQFRQGDVFLRQVRSIPVGASLQEQKERIVLAYGEVTGHAHAIHDLDAVDVLVKEDGTMYLRVKSETSLQHEEHATIVLPPGDYERVLQREYAPEGLRNVAD